MLKYKLTDQNNETRGNTKWGVGITHETQGSGRLCSPGWLHYYHTPELAVLLNPIHARFVNPKLWECDVDGKQLDDYGLKGGCTRLTTIREIPLPECSVEQRVEFGIRCALEVHHDDDFMAWANRWLDGSDRSFESAYCAAHAAADAVYSAVNATRAAAYVAFHTTEVALHAALAAFHAANHPSLKPDRLAAIASQVLAKTS